LMRASMFLSTLPFFFLYSRNWKNNCL
jgi:hypothetical protein